MVISTILILPAICLHVIFLSKNHVRQTNTNFQVPYSYGFIRYTSVKSLLMHQSLTMNTFSDYIKCEYGPCKKQDIDL